MKKALYADLVAQRKACDACPDLKNPFLLQFDSNEIGPWTRLHGDLNAEIMVVGQDWGDTRYFKTNQGLDDLRNPTTRMLEQLLQVAGFDVSLQSYEQGNRGLFLTNAILCLKEGGLQAKVESSWFKNCGQRFLRPQIELVAPKIVVALGQRAYEAILVEFGFKRGKFRSAVESPQGLALPCGSQLFAVYHCGRRILNTHRPPDAQIQDWRRIRAWLDSQPH
ncbi:MAG: uracil-DNA glycosylase family protein [Anaerolineales bacterium]|nr:uracil-DNA glycosylase family protein [Anaerolineales bacterium]